jgi:hypothetical protein
MRALYPLAHLGLARAAALTGDTAKSRKAYGDFFALWKDADPNIPILQQGKQEYDKLKIGLAWLVLADFSQCGLASKRGVDTRSKKVRELLSVALNEFGFGVTTSREDRQIYFSLVTTKAGIWLMNFE